MEDGLRYYIRPWWYRHFPRGGTAPSKVFHYCLPGGLLLYCYYYVWRVDLSKMLPPAMDFLGMRLPGWTVRGWFMACCAREAGASVGYADCGRGASGMREQWPHGAVVDYCVLLLVLRTWWVVSC